MIKKEISGEQKQRERLEFLLDQYKKIQMRAKSRIEKYEGAIKRKSVKNWSQDRKVKSVNRLAEANREFNEASTIIDQIQLQLRLG